MSDMKATMRVLWAGGIIALAAGIAYRNSFAGAFVLDDGQAILENASLRHLWPLWGALRATTLNSTANGRPLLNLSLAINYALSGPRPWSYHAVNLLIHLGAGLTLFGVARRTFLRTGWAASALPLGFALALLWTIHPLQTEAVTYVVQRAESLMALCYLLTLYGFIRSAEKESPGGSRAAGRGWAALAVAACGLGMAAKEDMVSAPLLVLLYDRTFVSGSFREAWRRHRRLLTALAGTWALLAALVLAGGGNRGGTVGLGVGTAWLDYVGTQFQAVATYLKLSLWPHPLIFDYGAPAVPPLRQLLPEIFLVGALVAATAYALWRHPAWGFLGAWFWALLAPTSLLPGTTQMIVEHRMYLPLAAVLAAVVLAVAGARRRWAPSLDGRVLLVGLLGVAAVGCLLTARRNRDYRSAVVLWGDNLRRRPESARAHASLADALLKSGRPAEAIPQFDQAMRRDPGNVETLSGEAAAFYQLHQLDAAVATYGRALRLRPFYPAAHNSLGVILAEQGLLHQAMAEYEFVLRTRPADPAAHFNLGNALDQAGRPAEAAAHFEAALRAAPDYAEAACNLGRALMEEGRTAEAVARFQEALRLRPDYPECDYNLGNAWFQTSHISQAIAAYGEALRLRPGYAEAESNLGLALLAAGRPAEAEEHYRAALRVDPHYAVAEYNLGNALAHDGQMPAAIAHYKAALRLSRTYPEAEINLGNALFQVGRPEEAIGYYLAALAYRPDNPRVEYNLGNALVRIGRLNEAANAYANAVRLDPNFAEARAMLVRIRP